MLLKIMVFKIQVSVFESIQWYLKYIFWRNVFSKQSDLILNYMVLFLRYRCFRLYYGLVLLHRCLRKILYRLENICNNYIEEKEQQQRDKKTTARIEQKRMKIRSIEQCWRSSPDPHLVPRGGSRTSNDSAPVSGRICVLIVWPV